MASEDKRLMGTLVIIAETERYPLDFAEETVLGYIKNGYGPDMISGKLGFNVQPVIDSLIHKRILERNLAFRYRSQEDWREMAEKVYTKACVFYDIKKEKYYDRIIYPQDLKFTSEMKLANYLGETWLDSLPGHFLPVETFEVLYPAAGEDPEGPVYSISGADSAPLEYIYEEMR